MKRSQDEETKMAKAKVNIRTIAFSTVGCLGFAFVFVIFSIFLHDARHVSGFSTYTTTGTAPVININTRLRHGLVTSVSLIYEDASNAMIDLSPFAGFTPKWSAEETLLHIGPPNQVYISQDHHLETHAYSRPGGEVRLIKAPGEAGDSVWLLEWQPNIGNLEKLVLDSELLRQATNSIPSSKVVEVSFYNESTKLNFSVRMSKEKVHDVNLWSRGIPAPSAENTRHDHPRDP
jgi:hypothetical protein